MYGKFILKFKEYFASNRQKIMDGYNSTLEYINLIILIIIIYFSREILLFIIWCFNTVKCSTKSITHELIKNTSALCLQFFIILPKKYRPIFSQFSTKIEFFSKKQMTQSKLMLVKSDFLWKYTFSILQLTLFHYSRSKHFCLLDRFTAN